MYRLSIRNGATSTYTTLTSAEIKAMLDPSCVEHALYISAIDIMEKNGIRYSNQDYDVLSGAYRAARQYYPMEPAR